MSDELDYIALQKLIEASEAVALCTVVKTKGSTPRKIGAKMAVVRNGDELGGILGTVGGGAIEHQIRAKALEVIDRGEPQLIETALAAELGMCCGGQMSVFIEPLQAKPKLIIFGAGHIGQALARLAMPLGFEVYVADPRESLLHPNSFHADVRLVGDYTTHDITQLPFCSNTYTVIVTHDHQMDQKIVERILRKPFRYAALVGSARKARLTVQRCLNRGFSKTEVEQLLSPAGINIHAQTPDEIALSILGQMTQCRRGESQSPFWKTQNSEIQKALATVTEDSVA